MKCGEATRNIFKLLMPDLVARSADVDPLVSNVVSISTFFSFKINPFLLKTIATVSKRTGLN